VVNVTPRPLYPGNNPVPTVQEAGLAAGPDWTGVEHLTPTGNRSPDRPARSESLYRLRYPGTRCWHSWTKFIDVPLSILYVVICIQTV
jgi:hypothetical protein